MTSSKIRDKVAYLFFVSFLFFPNIYFRSMFAYGILIFLFLLLFLVRLPKKNYPAVVFIISFFAINTGIRVFVFSESDLRDFIELGRIIFLVLGLYVFNNVNMSITKIKQVVQFYIIIDFIISFAQYMELHFALLTFIETLYTPSNHIEMTLLLSKRVMGLSSDPSSHGLMLLCLVTFLLVYYIQFEKSNSKSILLYLMIGFFIIIISQSQTAFIGLITLLITSIIYFFFKKKGNTWNYGFLILTVFLFVVYTIYYLIFKLRYLYSLFELGLGRNSYVSRENKWKDYLDMVIEKPLGLITGYGKDFFGQASGSMDSDYWYVFFVYGLPVFLVFIGLLLYFLKQFIVSHNRRFQLFAFPLLIGIPMAWPSSYYCTPKIMLFLIVLYSFSRKSDVQNTLS